MRGLPFVASWGRPGAVSMRPRWACPIGFTVNLSAPVLLRLIGRGRCLSWFRLLRCCRLCAARRPVADAGAARPFGLHQRPCSGLASLRLWGLAAVAGPYILPLLRLTVSPEPFGGFGIGCACAACAALRGADGGCQGSGAVCASVGVWGRLGASDAHGGAHPTGGVLGLLCVAHVAENAPDVQVSASTGRPEPNASRMLRAGLARFGCGVGLVAVLLARLGN